MKKCKSKKLKSPRPYIDELTVFINVKIESLNEFSKSIPLKVNNETNSSKEIIKIILIHIDNGALWWTRTTDPRFRKQMLYPAELRVHIIILNIFIV